MASNSIVRTVAREILDSRGNPTIEVDVSLEDGSFGRAAVPSGASTGTHEAVELRDGEENRYLGRGVRRAVRNVNRVLAPLVEGMDAVNQNAVDKKLKAADGTPRKENLGANAVLGVSLAVAKAAASHEGLPLYNYLSPDDGNLLPVPMLNILNGGRHADNNVDIQEFMVFPLGAKSFSEALRMGTETFHHLKNVLMQKGLNTGVGDEGGFAPDLESNGQAIELILEAAERAGHGMFLALDAAATEFYDEAHSRYRLESEGQDLSSDQMVTFYSSLVSQYPIVSIEDGLAEDDWEGWSTLNGELGDRIQIVGDDLTVTNVSRLEKAIETKAMNAILIKVNQVGTVAETIETVNLAREHGMAAIISHRSGETEDTSIADFAVAMGTGQIKTGSASRTDRICKYNELLRIEEALGSGARFPGMGVLGRNK